MTVFRAATLQTFFFAFHAGAKELKWREFRAFVIQLLLFASSEDFIKSAVIREAVKK